MNIRKEPSLEAEVVTVYPMNTIVEVLEVCDNWLKIKCPEAEDGIAYVLNEMMPMSLSAEMCTKS